MQRIIVGLKAVAFAGIVCLVSACGGGGGENPAVDARIDTQTSDPTSRPSDIPDPAAKDTSPAEPLRKQVRIAMYGDSTTAGAQTLNGVLFQSRQNEPVVLQSSLQSRFGPDASIIVYNEGVGGTEASQLLYGTDGKHRPFSVEMANSDAQIVVLNFGSNDSFYYAKPKDGVISESPDDFRSLMSELARIARSYGKTVVFQEPGPQCNLPAPGAPIYAYVFALREAAGQNAVPLVEQFDFMQTLPEWKSLISEDCVHPTDAGYAAKAARTDAIVSPLVAQLIQAG